MDYTIPELERIRECFVFQRSRGNVNGSAQLLQWELLSSYTYAANFCFLVLLLLKIGFCIGLTSSFVYILSRAIAFPGPKFPPDSLNMAKLFSMPSISPVRIRVAFLVRLRQHRIPSRITISNIFRLNLDVEQHKKAKIGP
jgi:hypothetical protein